MFEKCVNRLIARKTIEAAAFTRVNKTACNSTNKGSIYLRNSGRSKYCLTSWLILSKTFLEQSNLTEGRLLSSRSLVWMDNCGCSRC
jgi:hypothetical protein